MAYREIHILNESPRRLKVQCYAPGKKEKWGASVEINAGVDKKVYGSRMHEIRTPDLEITQIERVDLPNQAGTKDLTVKRAFFNSGRKQSWIVKEGNIVEKNRDNDEPKPKGDKHKWQFKAENIILKNIHYEVLNTDILDDAWKPAHPTTTTLPNNMDQEMVMTTTLAGEYTEAYNWAHEVGLTISVEATAEAGIPLLGKGELTVGAETNWGFTWGKEKALTYSWEQEINAKVPPNSAVEVTGIILEAEMDLPYTATLVLQYDDSPSVTTEICGVYKGVVAHRLIVAVDSEDVHTERVFSAQRKTKPVTLKRSSEILQPGDVVDLEFDSVAHKIAA